MVLAVALRAEELRREDGEGMWVDCEIQSASGTERSTLAVREDGGGEDAVVVVAVFVVWPAEEVRGGMALGDRRTLLVVGEAGAGVEGSGEVIAECPGGDLLE